LLSHHRCISAGDNESKFTYKPEKILHFNLSYKIKKKKSWLESSSQICNKLCGRNVDVKRDIVETAEKEIVLLDNVSDVVESGNMLAILGPSG